MQELRRQAQRGWNFHHEDQNVRQGASWIRSKWNIELENNHRAIEFGTSRCVQIARHLSFFIFSTGRLAFSLFHFRFQYTSFYDHTYHPTQDSMTWRLDYDKTSDFDDVSGHWHLESHPTKPDCTRVFYACDVKLKGAIPGPVANFISKSALKAATGWVKKESEKNPSGELDLAFVDKSKMTAGVE